MEQSHGRKYRNAVTVANPGPFNYNRTANRAAKLGSADWIVVANNDLVFSDGWLHELIAANHPVVSPKSPGDPRQQDVVENETGTVNGRHLSGWCYMIRRNLWRQIGGFDTCVDFWCSDDVVIEQVTAAGVQPMLVPGSVVKHLGSTTLRGRVDRDELTWAQVDIYNRKYGRDKFADNPHYLEWKKRQTPVSA
jgi:GT2 family glycosyltransferase